jgi:hypothetical protein
MQSPALKTLKIYQWTLYATRKNTLQLLLKIKAATTTKKPSVLSATMP